MENSTRNIALASIGTMALGAALYFLSKDTGDANDSEEEQSLITEKHTDAKLKDLLDCTHLELICIYARNFNMIQQARDARSMTPKFLKEVEHRVQTQMQTNMAAVWNEYCLTCYPGPHSKESSDHEQTPLTAASFTEWLSDYSDQEYVITQRNEITRMHHELFGMADENRLTHIDYSSEIPETLTKEAYIKMFRQVWSTIRHDLWKDLTQFKKDEGKDQVTEEEFSKIYEKRLTSFEAVRREVYEKVMKLQTSRPQEAKINMQKAYITFVTKPNLKPDGTFGLRSRWPDLVQEASLKHNDYIAGMMEGTYPSGVELDPRTTPDPSEQAVELLTSTKTSTEESVATKNVDKHIEQLLEVKRCSKELKAQRQAEAESARKAESASIAQPAQKESVSQTTKD